jgi:hypothetical protein
MTTAHEEQRPFAIGVRANPDMLTGVIVDLDGEVVPLGGKTAEPCVIARELRNRAPATVVEGVARLRDELLLAAGDLGGPVVGLGVAVGGHVQVTSASCTSRPTSTGELSRSVACSERRPESRRSTSRTTPPPWPSPSSSSATVADAGRSRC